MDISHILFCYVLTVEGEMKERLRGLWKHWLKAGFFQRRGSLLKELMVELKSEGRSGDD